MKLIKKQIEHLKELMKKAHQPPWIADIDDPETDRAMWTGKFYTEDYDKTWCTYGVEEYELFEHVVNAELVAAAITHLPALIKFWEENQ